MKVLSLLQPWATLVVMGLKTIETRSWSTNHRGPLLIHASLGRAGALVALESPFDMYINNFDSLPFGAIIGQVNLDDVLRVEQLFFSAEEINRLSLEERAFGDYSPGRYAWLLSDAKVFVRPIPIKGSLNLWNYSGPLSLR
ncbi:MAG: ASCH domain-containing protein [Candidatus Dadabacteria bacterium]